MTLEEIQVSLSKFEKLEILRSEKARLQTLLGEITIEIQDLLRDAEKRNFLVSISALYQNEPLDNPEGMAKLDSLKQRRQDLYTMIEAIDQNLNAVASETGVKIEDPGQGGASPSSGGGGDELAKFFKKK